MVNIFKDDRLNAALTAAVRAFVPHLAFADDPFY